MTFHDFFYDISEQLLHLFYAILSKLHSTYVDPVVEIIF